MTKTSKQVKIKFDGENRPIKLRIRHQIKEGSESLTVKRIVDLDLSNLSESQQRALDMFSGQFPLIQRQSVFRKTFHDQVTGEVKKDSYPLVDFDELKLPKLDGYYLMLDKKPVENVPTEKFDPNEDGSDDKLMIEPKAQSHKLTIGFIIDSKDPDEVNKVDALDKVELTALTDDPIDTSVDVPDDNLTFALANTDKFNEKQEYLSVIKSDMDSIDLKLNYDGQSPLKTKLLLPVLAKFKDETQKQTVKRIIKLHFPNEDDQERVQTVELTRKLKHNLFTNKDVLGNWSTGEFEAFDLPTIKGYHADRKSIPALDVTDESKDSTIDVNYQADQRTIALTIYDVNDPENKQVFKTYKLNAKTGDTLDLSDQLKLPEHYLFNSNEVETKYEVTPDTPDVIEYDIHHEIRTSTEHKKISRVVNIHLPNGHVDSTKQTAPFSRTVKLDLTDNKKYYGNWSANVTLSKVFTQEILGYTPTKTVEAWTVTPDDESQTIDIDYVADSISRQVKFVSTDGKIISTQLVRGKADETVDFNPELPENWQFVSENDVPEKLHIDARGNLPVTIMIEHQMKQLPREDLTITRTIHVVMPRSEDHIEKQVIHGSRDVMLDLVTNEKTYSNYQFQENGFDTYIVPNVKGYEPDRSIVSGVSANSDLHDETITIHYHPLFDEPTQKIDVKRDAQRAHDDQQLDILSDILAGKMSVDEGMKKGL